MKLTTKNFGEIEIKDSNIINFEEGIPGFSEDKKYAIILNDDLPKDLHETKVENSPLLWLQSIETPELAFVVLDSCSYYEDYDPKIVPEEIEILGEYDPETFEVYNIVIIPENMKDMTVNLKGPIVINRKEQKGKQVIVVNEEYGVRHRVFSLK